MDEKKFNQQNLLSKWMSICHLHELYLKNVTTKIVIIGNDEKTNNILFCDWNCYFEPEFDNKRQKLCKNINFPWKQSFDSFGLYQRIDRFFSNNVYLNLKGQNLFQQLDKQIAFFLFFISFQINVLNTFIIITGFNFVCKSFTVVKQN